MSRSSSNYQFLRETSQKLGKPLKARLHAHSFEAVLSLVAAGVGVALVPSSMLGAKPQGCHIAVVELAEPWALRELNLVIREDARLPSYVQDFIRHLLEDHQVSITRVARPAGRSTLSASPPP